MMDNREKEMRDYIVHLLMELTDIQNDEQEKKLQIYNRIFDLIKLFIHEEVRNERE